MDLCHEDGRLGGFLCIQVDIDSGVPLRRFFVVGKDRNGKPQLKVDSGKSKLDVVHRPKLGIVLTKKGVVAIATLVLTRDKGTVFAWPMQIVVTAGNRDKGDALSSSKIQSSKRTNSRKDTEGSTMVSKKASASCSVSDHVPADVPHLKALVPVEHEDWALLDVLCTRSSLPWLLGGHLNAILTRHEKDSGRHKP
ncbi:hypothetical protein GQ457_04G022940 [Hibiscus cannabinus]